MINKRRALLALVACLLGCDSEAARAQLSDARGPDSLTAQVERAVQAWQRGDHAAAYAGFERVVDASSRVSRLTPQQLIAVGTAARHLGRRDPQLFRTALRAFDAAAAADTTSADAHVLAGELFLEKYNSADAQRAFAAALQVNPRHPRALLGVARRLQFDGQSGAREQVERALEIEPGFVAGRVFLASLDLDDERYEAARAEIGRALAADSASLDARSMLAAVHHMSGDARAAESARREVLARNPRHAELFETLAELSARHRLYEDAVRFAAQGVAVDSTAWGAWGLLGLNELRTGRTAEAKEHLETSFRGDPYNVWIKNTLDLLDAQRRYVASESPRFRFLVERGEADLLSPYLAALSEEAYAALSERYGYRPTAPILLEVYRRHADFSVRTVGLPGMGALGVSFGRVLAMDSPGARERGSFNWGSTVWHEVAHTFTLGVTDHRIPRWLSEGLSVLEERRARPGWGAQGGIDFLMALKQGRLQPVSRLSESFVRPSYPAQVAHAYYQASLVCELIERDWGWPAMRALLAEYRRGRRTDAAFRSALRVDLDEFDRRFDRYLGERFARPLAALPDKPPEPMGSLAAVIARADSAPNDLLAQLAAGRGLIGAERRAEALPYVERARAIYPDYGGPDSPWRMLAEVHRATEPRKAAEALARYTALAESDYEANVLQATLLEELGDSAGATAALERAVWIHPYDPALHQRLAVHYTQQRQVGRAVRERAAVVALDPADRPDALYQLARAQYAARDLPAARKSVLAALELAPAFEPAQALLLEMRREGGTAGRREQ